MAVYHAIRRIALMASASGWTAIVAPIAASSLVIENTSSSAIYVRTERTPDNYKRVPANTEYPIRSEVMTWEPDTEICEVQAPSADAVLVVSFTR